MTKRPSEWIAVNCRRSVRKGVGTQAGGVVVKGAFVGRRSRVFSLGVVLVALVAATLVATVESAGAVTPTFVQQRSATPASAVTVTATYQNAQGRRPTRTS